MDPRQDEDGIRAQVVVAGMFREGDPEAHDLGFFGNALGQLHEHWLDAALAERGVAPGTVDQALVVFGAEGPKVLLGDEVAYTAVAGPEARLARPQDCFVGHITSIWPDGVDPDVAWNGYATAQGGRVLVFDFRKNRDRVVALLDRARQFGRSCGISREAGLLAPAVEHLNTSAELAVMALIQLEGWDDKRRHDKRRQWLRDSCRYGSTPAEFADAFDRLAAERNPARYAEGPQSLASDDLATLEEVVGRLVDYAAARRG